MFWRLEPAEYDKGFPRDGRTVTGGRNKAQMQRIVRSGKEPGLLAYREGRPVGWVSVSPRSDLVRLAHSPGLRSADEEDDPGAWSIACLYVYRSEWRQGVGEALLAAALEYARKHGATQVEGYPVKPGSIDPYTGYESMFAEAGFHLERPGRGMGRSLWRRKLGSRRTIKAGPAPR
jgi:GNAT superfamily N-acetyltransferase